MKRNKIAILMVAMLLLVCFTAAAVPMRQNHKVKQTFEWDFRIEAHEPDGKWDYAIFGEKPDASDLVDQYDVPKCPSPPGGYIRMYFYNPDLTYPYNYAWYEYKQSPDTYKSWLLKVQWVPQTGDDDTEVTLSWEQTGRTEYKDITINGIRMRKHGSFTFTCPAYTPQWFEIICSRPSRLMSHKIK